jgi:hypothetical protein
LLDAYNWTSILTRTVGAAREKVRRDGSDRDRLPIHLQLRGLRQGTQPIILSRSFRSLGPSSASIRLQQGVRGGFAVGMLFWLRHGAAPGASHRW